ncbi:MAG: hypothetical protein LUG18_02925 [Candidatus Azobacteroides sp.]|nr:hypothetical protein [Candidatus Azobacteroides sp.]
MKKKVCLGVFLLLVSFFTCYAAVSGNRESGIQIPERENEWAFSLSAAGKNKGSLFSAESSRESFFSERPVVFSSENSIKDEESELNAPPPGEDGYPQKILPLNLNPWKLLMGFSLVFIWNLKRKRIQS